MKKKRLLTLSKNSFPQLTQNFATEIRFKQLPQKSNKIQHRLLGFMNHANGTTNFWFVDWLF